MSRELRSTPSILRRRGPARQRAQLLTHIVNTNTQFNLPPFPKRLSYRGNRNATIADRFADPSTRLMIQSDLALSASYDAQIDAIEDHLVTTAQVDDAATFAILKTIPGIGPILGLTLLYEIDQITRFPAVGNFLSYARLVRCEHSSAGKVKGSGPRKVGNAHLKWAFSEAACLMKRCCPAVRSWCQRQEAKRGKRKTLAVLEAKIGRSVYHVWRKQQAFDLKRFLHG